MTPKTSKRLIRAAQAEQAQLETHRGELLQRRDQLRQDLDAIERGLHAIDERMRLLQRLAGAPGGGGATNGEGEVRPVAAKFYEGGEALELLRGTAIRETGVRLLAERGGGPIHYRDWQALLRESGYAVSGKDPNATLLSQISRSPVVRRTTSAGVYEIDHEAPERLRRELARLHAELRQLTTAPAAPQDSGRARARRDELVGQINACERALDEADRVLNPPAPVATAAA